MKRKNEGERERGKTIKEGERKKPKDEGRRRKNEGRRRRKKNSISTKTKKTEEERRRNVLIVAPPSAWKTMSRYHHVPLYSANISTPKPSPPHSNIPNLINQKLHKDKDRNLKKR